MNGAAVTFSPRDSVPWPQRDPHAYLAAMRAHLDGFNPDRRQVEKQRHRKALIAAMQEARAQGTMQGYAAERLFPELRSALSEPVQQVKTQPAEQTGAAGHAFSGQPSPFTLPKVAPSARPARGTPFSVSLRSVPSLRAPCNRELTLYPTSWRAVLVLVAFGFGIKGNGALLNRKHRP